MYIWLFIVPVAAKSLAKLDDLIEINIFGYGFVLDTNLPFSWKIFYVSAFLIVLANIVFIVHCPKIIKKFNDYSDYDLGGNQIQQLLPYVQELNKDWFEIEQRVEIRIEDEKEHLTILDGGTFNEVGLKGLFWEIHILSEEHKPNARWMATVFYYLAFLLLVFVFSQNAFYVFSSFFSK
ncbi:MAG: hypothetical protein AB8D52_09015 [Gammaproteobacteria bacterium]